jgi:ketosteroid isomerase-like protein
MQAEIISIDVEILDKLNKAYVASVQKSDVRWFDEHLSEDFLNSNPDGTIVDRAGFLAQIAKPVALKGLEPREVKIRLFGGFAIIHAKTVYRKPDGQTGAGRYTDIWQRRDGRWLCVAAHVTRG